MSTSHFAPHVTASHRLPLPTKPATGLPPIRKGLLAPEVIPVLGAASLALGIGAYIRSGAAHQMHRTRPWLEAPTDRTNWDGVREVIVEMGAW